MKQNNDDVKLLFWAGDHACIKREDNTFDSINAEDVDRINAALASIPAPALIEDNMEVYEAGWDDAMLAMKSTQPAPADGVGEGIKAIEKGKQLAALIRLKKGWKKSLVEHGDAVAEDFERAAQYIEGAYALLAGALRQDMSDSSVMVAQEVRDHGSDSRHQNAKTGSIPDSLNQPQTVSVDAMECFLAQNFGSFNKQAKAIAKAFPNGLRVEE